MNKKIVVVVIIFIICFWIVGICRKNMVLQKSVETSNDGKIVKDEEVVDPDEITIYDIEEGYLKVAGVSNEGEADAGLFEALKQVNKGTILPVHELAIKEGETTPPKRYNSGSMILAMENAGQLIEDEELRAQIKGSGIGTSATRAEILKKLIHIKYLNLNNKTQIITPTLLGELVFDVVEHSIRSLLNPELTASWEKGLTYVAEGQITSDEYMAKLENFIAGRTSGVMGLNNQYELRQCYSKAAQFYK
jgi:DNA topoisomerase-3